MNNPRFRILGSFLLLALFLVFANIDQKPIYASGVTSISDFNSPVATDHNLNRGAGDPHSPENSLDIGVSKRGIWDEPVYASASGTVSFVGWRASGTGYTIEIDHGNSWSTTYGHLSAFSIANRYKSGVQYFVKKEQGDAVFAVSVGEQVAQGQLIGFIGNTGTETTGAHLHFQINNSNTEDYPAIGDLVEDINNVDWINGAIVEGNMPSDPSCADRSYPGIDFFTYEYCLVGDQTGSLQYYNSTGTHTVNFNPVSSIYVGSGWSLLVGSDSSNKICANRNLWDLNKDKYPDGQSVKDNINYVQVFNDSTCGGTVDPYDPKNDLAGVFVLGIGGASTVDPTTGFIRIYEQANYQGSFGGLYTIGSHMFPTNTQMFSIKMEYDTESFILHALDGRSRCFNQNISNLQDHESWWYETVKIEVFNTDVCGDGTSGYVEVYNQANYSGTKLGNYATGTHTFSPSTLMYSFKLMDGAESFVVHAADGRTRCFNQNIPNMQDHEEWWHQTILLDVYIDDVCVFSEPPSITGIVGYWNFNETSGSIFNDEVNNNDMYVASGYAFDTGVIQNGLVNDGSHTAYITDPSSVLKPETDDPFSLSFWIDGSESSGLDYHFLSMINACGDDAGWWVQMDKSTGTLTYFFAKNDGAGNNHATTLSITDLLDGGTHHVVLTFSGMSAGKTIKTYRDGILIDNKTISGGGDISYNSNSCMDMYVGGSTVATVDDLKIYRDEISKTDVDELFEAGVVDFNVYPEPTSTWIYSQTLSIDATQVADDLTGFPVLLSDNAFSTHVYVSSTPFIAHSF